MQLTMSKIDRPIKYLLLLSIKQIVTPLLLHDTLSNSGIQYYLKNTAKHLLIESYPVF